MLTWAVVYMVTKVQAKGDVGCLIVVVAAMDVLIAYFLVSALAGGC